MFYHAGILSFYLCCRFSDVPAVLHIHDIATNSQASWNEAITECSEALRLKPGYTKALSRRAKAFEETDRQAEALEGMTV